MSARIREAWERVKAAGIDVLTEGIRLAQTAGEHVLQQIAERQLRVPSALHGVLERLAGREPEREKASDDIEFVCKPAGPYTFDCKPANESASEEVAGTAPPKPPRRKAPVPASQQPPKPAAPKAVAPRRPRKKKSLAPPKPVAPPPPAEPEPAK